MTVTFTGHLSDWEWGSARRWNAWVEFHSGVTLVASSADNDFALISGQVTEDISRGIRRDVQLTLLFPSNPYRRALTTFTLITSGPPFMIGKSLVGDVDVVGGAGYEGAESFEVGESEIGGEDEVGGSGGTTMVTESFPNPGAVSDTARSVFIPTEVGDLLDPHSLSTMRVYAGFEDEEVLLGYFDLAETSVRAEAGGAVVEVTAHSFEWRLDRAGFWQMEAFADDTLAVDAVRALVHEVMPDVQFAANVGTAAIGELSWKPGDNRLSKITELLALAGMEGGFTRDNTYAAETAPNVNDFGNRAPQWDIIDGVNARVATLNSASRKFSDADSYNGVVVEGTAQTGTQTAPVFAARWNLNPSSPLYFDPANPSTSGMGARPKHIQSQLVKTQADADAMATVELAKVLMLTDSVDAMVPANAGLEMGHYARLVCDAMGVDGVYRIGRVVHDLGGGTAELSLYRFTGV